MRFTLCLLSFGVTGYLMDLTSGDLSDEGGLWLLAMVLSVAQDVKALLSRSLPSSKAQGSV